MSRSELVERVVNATTLEQRVSKFAAFTRVKFIPATTKKQYWKGGTE